MIILTVREWIPDFRPSYASIGRVAVWIRVSGFPIEYYDPKILHDIGNRIGRLVKIDMSTLLQERGKYARICVEVDLSKPLLAIFELKKLLSICYVFLAVNLVIIWKVVLTRFLKFLNLLVSLKPQEKKLKILQLMVKLLKVHGQWSRKFVGPGSLKIKCKINKVLGSLRC